MTIKHYITVAAAATFLAPQATSSLPGTPSSTANAAGASALYTAGSPLFYREVRERLEAHAQRRFGSAYGCVLEPGVDAKPSNPRALILQVTRRRDTARAREMIARAGAQTVARVGYVSPRQSEAAYLHILAAIGFRRSHRPAGVLDVIRGTFDRTQGCPPVEVLIASDPRVSRAGKRWGSRWERRFGFNRVKVRAIKPGVPLPGLRP